jgi:hypothetical protein
MLWLLRKFIDSIVQGDEEVELRRLQNDRQVDLQPDGGGRVLLDESSPREPPGYACRVCGHRSLDGSYCPTCVALTMVERGAAR